MSSSQDITLLIFLSGVFGILGTREMARRNFTSGALFYLIPIAAVAGWLFGT